MWRTESRPCAQASGRRFLIGDHRNGFCKCPAIRCKTSWSVMTSVLKRFFNRLPIHQGGERPKDGALPFVLNQFGHQECVDLPAIFGQ